MMKFLGHVLALLLATVLSLSISSWILEQTLWSAPYLERQADQTGLYDKLATGLPAAFAAADPETAQSAQPALDPNVLKGQLENLLPQFIDHLHRSGPAPTVDLAALAAATGQPAPDGPAVQRLDLGSADPKLTEAGAKLRLAGQFAPLVAIIVIVLIILVMRERRFPTLIRGFFETMVALLISAGLIWIVPLLLANALGKPTLIPIRTAITPFIESVAHAIAIEFAAAAAIMLAAGIILWAVHGGARLKAKFTPKSKPAAKTPDTLPS